MRADIINLRMALLPGCYTYGETLDMAKKMATEALTGYLESIDSRKLKVPEPSKIKQKNVYYIEPEKKVAFAIWLKKQREKAGLSQTEIAAKLGIKYQTYQRFEDPVKTNPTLSTIIKLEQVFHKELVQI